MKTRTSHFDKARQKERSSCIFVVLLIIYKKKPLNFIFIISFSLDKMKMKWYNQSTFVMEVLP